jgi:pSer/pThr/pTyr-binding forkhead associated (FHA) protein/tetratricopeptide (TPR) repeat protein
MAENFPKFIITQGPEEGKEFSLANKESFKVGRAEDNDFMLDDTSLSRHHATIYLSQGQWKIKDEGSRNGSFINNQQIQPDTSENIQHLDLIKLGVYEIRFATQEITNEDIKTHQDKITEDSFSQSQDSSNKKAKTIENKEPDDLAALETDLEELENAQQDSSKARLENEPRPGKSLAIFTVLALAFCLFGLIIFFSYKYINTEPSPEEDLAEVTVVNMDDVKADTQREQDNQQQDNVTAQITEEDDATNTDTPFKTIPYTDTPEQPSTLRDFVVILDIKTEPLPATIYFKEENLCSTPCKRSVSVQANKVYTLYADFDLREIGDIYRKKIDFKVKPDTDVMELKIDAEIGILKVMKLPRKVEFYLEGYYAYDKLKANPAKISDVIYGRPIYLPYGRYIVELREKTKVAGSDNLITQIRYQREYNINKDNRTIELKVIDRDLQFFPAIIKSVPKGAKVFYGNDEVGVTPYSGKLPLGKNKIKISKDGFFTTVIDINMTMNSIYETTIHLKTSKIGELLNDAKDKVRHEDFEDAIDILINALKYGGSTREKAEVYYMLGSTYLKMKNYTDAKSYLEKASAHKDFYHLANLGIVQIYHANKDTVKALKLIVEIMVNIDANTPSPIRTEANSVFKQISPVKSVMYIYTDPPKAKVFVNDKPLSQATPLILSDLGLGNYRLQIEKSGYETYKTKQNIKIGEFLVIKVKLKKEQI